MAHTGLYNQPLYYQLGCGFKNIKLECDSLLELYNKYSKKYPEGCLEIFAGPALNALEMSSRGINTTAIDTNPVMREYALSKAVGPFNYLLLDAIDFHSSDKFDLAFSLMDSMAYLTKDEQVISHLKCVAQALNPNGLYIAELGHPKFAFSTSDWIQSYTHKDQEGELTLTWGDDTDKFDPITLTIDSTIKLRGKYQNKELNYRETAKQRVFFYNEWKLLVQASGVFDLIGCAGSLSGITEFSLDKSSWRMIPIMRRKDHLS